MLWNDVDPGAVYRGPAAVSTWQRGTMETYVTPGRRLSLAIASAATGNSWYKCI